MRKLVLLVVEDNISDEKLALLAFRKSGRADEVVVVRDGAEALDYLFAAGAYAGRAGAPLPALMLLDLKLPKVDGHEVLRRVRADDRTKLLPVVVLTTSREDEDVQRCYDLGANAYLRKPVEFTAFVEMARAIGAFWLEMNQPAPPPRVAG